MLFAKDKDLYRKIIYIILYGSCVVISLPYGLSWVVGFWALSHLIFEEKKEVSALESNIQWVEIVVLSILPVVIFILNEKVALDANNMFNASTGHGEFQWFPGVIFMPLYLIPVLWRTKVRKEALKSFGLHLNRWHMLLITLSLAPILSGNIQRAAYYQKYFKSIPDEILVFSAIKPFYFNGLWEELYYRGLIFSLLLTRVKTGSAIVLSALIFTFSHYNLLQAAGDMELSILVGRLLGVYFLGLVTAYVFWRSGSIWPSVCFHSFNSGSAYLTAYIARHW
jgi:membrane protease YdiL (CAAX protease family)